MTGKFLKRVIITALVLGFFSINLAETHASTTEENKKIEEVNEIAKSIDSNFEVTSIEDIETDRPKIEVNSEEELEALLEKMAVDSIQGEETSLTEQPSLIEKPLFSTLAYGSFTRKALVDALSTFRHVTYQYKTKNGKITSVTKIKGTYTGVYIFSFNQEFEDYSLSKNKKSINFIIKGYAFSGISFKGADFGIKYPQTWKYTHSPL
ncbi:hypothetical protein [Paraliobacillus sp. X-1268]|uniref:hypothetical protein n=1 Tax=Paraliobacillus sp. X-1268 TaxID=2213193 RepID=UPI000E3D0931|nr:hypothetical protein [Paraliobacillus sp. X-1268]